jgi:hypothetical protein
MPRNIATKCHACYNNIEECCIKINIKHLNNYYAQYLAYFHYCMQHFKTV